MILPQSLHPGMTRGGFTYRNHIPVRSADIDNYPVTRHGLWLPTIKVGKRELEMAKARLGAETRPAFTDPEALARAAIKGMAMNDMTGCWVSDGVVDASSHTSALWEIADQDMGGPPLDPETIESKEELRLCDDEGCLNARHYDFTHKKKYREELIRPNYHNFRTLEDGRILPIWEKSRRRALPSVADSIVALRKLQLRCPPFVDAQDAPLTGNGISKITIDPITGCWMVRMYYTRPEHHLTPGFQYDGYGRLGRGKLLRPNGEPATQGLAHRVVWQAVGKKLIPGMELNHKCGVRPCANPSHLEQVTKSANNLHAHQMALARRALDAVCLG